MAATTKKNAPAELRVHGVIYQDYKRLQAVAIRIERGATVISGKNRAGKTSALDGIAAALGGAKLCPQNPIRKGATEARVTVDVGVYLVTRTWKLRDGEITSALKIERPDGGVMPRPQELLDAIFSGGRAVFHPLDFVALGETAEGRRRQADTLRRLAGYNTEDIDAEQADLIEKRRAGNREANALEQQLAAMPEPVEPASEAAPAEKSVAELMQRHQRALDRRRDVEAAVRELGNAESRRRSAEAEVAKLENTLANARRLVDELTGDEAAKKESLTQIRAEPGEDAEAIAIEMHDAEAHNRGVREQRAQAEGRRRAFEEAKRARAAKVAELERRTLEVAAHELRLTKIAEERGRRLAAAKFPIPGLGVEGDRVTLNGVDFATGASGAEQLRTALAIQAALNPGVKTIPLQEKARLDEAGLRAIAQWSEETGVDVILERVAEAPGLGIYIEDGGVVDVGPNDGRVMATTAADVPPAF